MNWQKAASPRGCLKLEDRNINIRGGRPQIHMSAELLTFKLPVQSIHIFMFNFDECFLK